MRRLLAPVGAFVIGIAWAGSLAQQRLDAVLALENEVRDLQVVGVIAELPQRFDNGLRFDFAVEQAPVGVPQHISVAWYRSFRVDEENPDAERQQVPDLRAGERWRLTLRLKRPHGNFNPHGFDIEDWLLERGVRATGYVRVAPTNLRLDAFVVTPAYAIERVRQTIRDRFLTTLADQPYAGVLIALVIGDQQAIDAELWQIFAQTGLTHLMSISGLHVTMVAGLYLVRLAVATIVLADAAASGATGSGVWRHVGGAGLLSAGRIRRAGATHALHAHRCGTGAVRAAQCGRIFGPRFRFIGGVGARSMGGIIGRILVVVRLCRHAAFRRCRAARSAALVARMGAGAVGSDGRHDPGGAGAVPAVFAGIAFCQRAGNSAGESRGYANGIGSLPFAVAAA
jgi:hypothetical protein